MKEVNRLIYFLTAFGFFCLACIIVYFLVCLVADLKEQFDELVYMHRIRHQLDKPPTAKCYCIGCGYHDNETGRCSSFGEFIADDCFCWKAYPRIK